MALGSSRLWARIWIAALIFLGIERLGWGDPSPAEPNHGWEEGNAKLR
jgi:hypothetical protein